MYAKINGTQQESKRAKGGVHPTSHLSAIPFCGILFYFIFVFVYKIRTTRSKDRKMIMKRKKKVHFPPLFLVVIIFNRADVLCCFFLHTFTLPSP